MKRKIMLFLMAAGCFVLQNTVLKSMQFVTVTPNLLLILTAGFGVVGGDKEGMYLGFLSGLFMDIFYGNLFGYYILLYTFIGYLNGVLGEIFNVINIKLPMFLIALSDLGFGMIQYFVNFALRGKFDFQHYFMKIILPEFIFTMIMTLFVFQLISYADEKLEKPNARSEDDFVG